MLNVYDILRKTSAHDSINGWKLYIQLVRELLIETGWHIARIVLMSKAKKSNESVSKVLYNLGFNLKFISSKKEYQFSSSKREILSSNSIYLVRLCNEIVNLSL